MKIKRYSCLAIIAFMALSCSTSKIDMGGDSMVAYQKGDEIALIRLEGIKTHYANLLYNDAVEVFSKRTGLKVIDESDLIYNLKTKGLDKPEFDKIAKAELLNIHQKTGVDFILVSKVISLENRIKESDFKQATIAFKLIDLRHQLVTINLDITTTMPPMVYQDNNGLTHETNINSSFTAATKAYNKAIKKFYSAFD